MIQARRRRNPPKVLRTLSVPAQLSAWDKTSTGLMTRFRDTAGRVYTVTVSSAGSGYLVKLSSKAGTKYVTPAGGLSQYRTPPIPSLKSAAGAVGSLLQGIRRNPRKYSGPGASALAAQDKFHKLAASPAYQKGFDDAYAEKPRRKGASPAYLAGYRDGTKLLNKVAARYNPRGKARYNPRYRGEFDIRASQKRDALFGKTAASPAYQKGFNDAYAGLGKRKGASSAYLKGYRDGSKLLSKVAAHFNPRKRKNTGAFSNYLAYLKAKKKLGYKSYQSDVDYAKTLAHHRKNPRRSARTGRFIKSR